MFISTDGEVQINNADVDDVDIEATNGVIHIINSVLEFTAEGTELCPGQSFGDYCDCGGDCQNQPSWCSCEAAQAASCCNDFTPLPNIVGVAVEEKFTTLVKAVQAAGLVDYLSENDGLTVFAPTDAAFAKIEGIDAYIADRSNREGLVSLLTNHVIQREVYSEDLSDNGSILTAGGELLKVTISSDGVMINNAKIVVPDVSAYNGVIHAIDEVLSFDEEESEETEVKESISSEEGKNEAEKSASSEDGVSKSEDAVSSADGTGASKDASSESSSAAGTIDYMSGAIISAISLILSLK